ncbi:hypothetical protein DSM106972_023190 [Dulcicalothrix desertica PCC 7102]|uniref:Uncharacterized protein n=1 Tax=Dulcicalothrix desertica PCC 7102 TaxID=232991 RepID=A0A433VLP0_9CYAN|nr:hypothetical protein [Dulcicalothrix desertica]RUT07058.1 hypothetical protein DSM106972_023190 [Dulcicalothrix desertica PCC 7102]TWH61944.1 hypothetical protein CAL7102_00627 [Dulcicalothrix desertica PCC 7102]
MGKNGNGHRGFWNPVKIFIRTLLGQWEKRNKVDDEIYLVNSEVVKNDIDDVVDEPHDESQDDRN